MRLFAAVVALLAFVITDTAAAQITIPGAGDQTIPLLGSPTSLNVEFSKAKLGFSYTTFKYGTALETDCGGLEGYQAIECRDGAFREARARGWWEASAGAGLALVDGKRDLFSGGRVVPGLDLAAGMRRVLSRDSRGCRLAGQLQRKNGGFVPDEDGPYVTVFGRPDSNVDPLDREIPVDDNGVVLKDTVLDGPRYRWNDSARRFYPDTAGVWIATESGYRRIAGHYVVCSTVGEHALVASVQGSWSRVKTVEFLDAAQTTALLRDDLATKTIGLTLGYERWFTQSNKLGLFATAGYSWDSPGPNKPNQVCTVGFTAVDTAANHLVAQKCDDRIVSPLVDDYSVQPEVNYLLQFPRASGPTWGLIAGTSAKLQEEYKPTYNAVAGVTLHPDGKPNEVMAALLLATGDFTDGNDRDLDFWEDQFSVRLFLTLGLALFN